MLFLNKYPNKLVLEKIERLVSSFDNVVFVEKENKSMMLHFFIILIYIFLINLCAFALSIIHGSFARALIQSIILSTLVLPGVGFIFCIFRRPTINQIADNYAEGRYFVLPITLTIGLALETYHQTYIQHSYGINIKIFIYITVASLLIFSLIGFLFKAEFGTWEHPTDKVRFTNSTVSIIGAIIAVVLTVQLMG